MDSNEFLISEVKTGAKWAVKKTTYYNMISMTGSTDCGQSHTRRGLLGFGHLRSPKFPKLILPPLFHIFVSPINQ